MPLEKEINMFKVQVRLVCNSTVKVVQGMVNVDKLRKLRTLHGSNNVTIVID